MPPIDSDSGFLDAPPTAAAVTNVDESGFLDAPSAPPATVSGTRALGEGVLSGASANLRDEIFGLSQASGLPHVLGGFRAPVGAARLGYEYLTGQPGSATQTYESERDRMRAVQKAAQEQHPWLYGGGELAGGALTALAAPGPGLAETVGGRMAQGAATGGVAGAAYGFGGGEGGLESLKGAGIGAGTGAALGGVLSPVLDAAMWGAGKLGSAARSTFDILRAEGGPGSIDTIAARRVAQARAADIAAGRAPGPVEQQAAEAAGIPGTLADTGESAQALARSAANQSPDARAALTETTQQRFYGQSQRAADFVRGLTGGGKDAYGLQQDLEQAARAANKPAYAKAYGAPGADAVWDEGFEQMLQAPVVQDAVRKAMVTARNDAAKEGFTPPQNPFVTDANGRLTLAADEAGNRALPSLQFWDHVKRNLDTVGTRESQDWARVMRSRLDEIVPEYATARSGAAAAFGAQDALGAGRNFVTAKGQNSEFAAALGSMSEPEKELFARGFASEMADRIRELRDPQSVLSQAFLTSPASRQRIQIALGRDRANQLEAYLRAEALADRVRTAVTGNSTTARQLIEGGLMTAGGATTLGGYEAYQGELTPGKALGLALVAAAGGYKKVRVPALQEALAKRVGEMLASNDPQMLQRGAKIVARNDSLMNALRAAGEKFEGVIPAIGAQQAQGLAQ
jgi:hypothetical protein